MPEKYTVQPEDDEQTSEAKRRLAAMLEGHKVRTIEEEIEELKDQFRKNNEKIESFE